MVQQDLTPRNGKRSARTYLPLYEPLYAEIDALLFLRLGLALTQGLLVVEVGGQRGLDVDQLHRK